jgi:hypothetical protein
MPLPAGIAIAMGAASLAKGVGQFVEGRKQKKAGEELLAQRVKRGEVPEHMQKALETQKYLSGTDLPGREAAEAGMRQNIAQQHEQGLKTARGANQAQGMLERGTAGVQQGMRDLNVRGEEYKTQQQQNLVGAENKMGETEMALEQQQYNRQMAQDSIAREQISAGKTNQYNAVSDTISSIGILGPDLGAAFGGMGGKGGSQTPFDPTIDPMKGTTMMSDDQYGQQQAQYPPLTQVPGGQGDPIQLANQNAAAYQWNPYN